MAPGQVFGVVVGIFCIIVVIVVLGTAFGWWDPLHLIDSGKDDDD